MLLHVYRAEELINDQVFETERERCVLENENELNGERCNLVVCFFVQGEGEEK